MKTIRPYWMKIAAMMICHIAIAACAVAFVYVSKVMVDKAVAVHAGTAEGEGWEALGIWAAAMGGIIIVRILLNAIKSYIQTKTDVKLRNRLRSRMFDMLLNTRVESGTGHHSGDLVNRVFEDVRVVASAISGALPNTIGAGLQFVAALVFLLILDIRLAIVLAVIVPIGALGGR